VRPEEAVAWLDSHVNLELGVGAPRAARRMLAVDRVRPLVDLLGSPQFAYPSVHVTGTNGKTSVARMTTALLVATGLSTGSYTSPHLERVNERMAWNGEPIDDETLVEQLVAVADVEPFLDEAPSYFEILTAAALHWFDDIAVQAAVVEVGMGGAGDATNVVDGRVAVVTNVTIDHVEYLGPDRDDIAREKAGIVKPTSTLLLGETDAALVPIFLDRGAASVLTRDVDFGVRSNAVALGGRLLDLYTPGGSYPDVFVPLHGAHQADNAAVALAAAEALLDRPLEPAVVGDAFASVRSPGRLEVVGHRPLVLLDGAHNVAGAHALRDALAEEFGDGPRTLVVGLLRQKEPHEMLAALGAAEAARVVCCRAPSPRAIDPDELAAAARDLGVDGDRIDVVDDVREAVAHAIASAEPTGHVVVTGSLYVVGAARGMLVH
jgi:dihydrofolate synthase/folylpolyglutamate synthase